MTDVAAQGLREQKRAATRRALRVTLLRMALERGFDGVTVEEVAQAVGVSPRTFFNYFSSKEDAVGAPHEALEVDPAERAQYLAGEGDPLTDLVRLIAGRSADAEEEFQIHVLRRRLMEAESRLLGAKLTSAHRVHLQLTSLVVERLLIDAARAGEPEDESVARTSAELIVPVATAIVRAGWSRWAGGEGAVPLREVLLRSIDDFVGLARTVVATSVALDPV